YLNALTGKGVHIVTVNDYLAKRDSEWMGQIHRFLGLSVGCIDNSASQADKKQAYLCDITYGTNNEYGFDYLRDNLAIRTEDLAQRQPHYAIIDEVDSILIDEARTPLIISGPTDDKSDLYHAANNIVLHFKEEHYELDEESKSVTLNDDGYDLAENLLQEKGIMTSGHLYDNENLEVIHHVTQALKAHILFQKDRDYIVKNKKVILIDEFTGRMMDGRRFSDGLHQALEAKENVDIQPENQTLSSVTFQNYFRLYDKLSGMTGTAETEASEFKESFGLKVVQIPTNLPVQRHDENDALYMTREEKVRAIIEDIVAAREAGRPVLVGTTSIERSEELSKSLKKEKIKHQVLNARYHEQEAQIIAQAGRLGAVTISTNMAGRGTDIQLGGSLEMRIATEIDPSLSDAKKQEKIKALEKEVEAEKQKVIAAGGLYVIGTERHESRRIDNQLRGRSGRQGDKGRSRFFLSLEDDLLRIFGGDKLKNLLSRVGMEKGDALEDRMLSKAIIRAQKKIEQKNYEARRQLMKYDDIINEQRSIIFARRRKLVEGDDFTPIVHELIKKYVADIVPDFCDQKSVPEDWDIQGLKSALKEGLGEHDYQIDAYLKGDGLNRDHFMTYLTEKLQDIHLNHISSWDESILQGIQRECVLRPLDFHWRHHLAFLDRLGKMIGFRGYGQKDPLIEYKKEAFESFGNFLRSWRFEALGRLLKLRIEYEAEPTISAPTPPPVIDIEDYPRNAECPCGSGKKIKHCHGALLKKPEKNVAV
ncbi:MAG: preprotein translocase subunit SecA, partial [Pseudomonadota bacterium]